MADLYGFDAFSPGEVAHRIDAIGVVKARLPLRAMGLLAMLAGAFIGLGAALSLLVGADAALPFAARRLAGGVAFSLGLLLVVVAGAELFTGNNLLAMAWASGRIGTREVLRNWVVVCAGNFVGASGLALLVWLARTGDLDGGRLGAQALALVAAKSALPPTVAFFKGVLCNVLVCMAVWMAAAGRSVVDKAVAIVPPIAAFVALGFEHSIANMFFFPFAMLLDPARAGEIGLAMLADLGPVIAGNLVGGSVLVAGIYWVIYERDRRPPAPPPPPSLP